MWIKGFCPTIWDDSYKQYEYTRQPITGEESHMWKQQGYTHKSTTGKMYGSKNQMPQWVENISNIIGLYKCGYVFYRMDTLDIMPTHIDHYNTYCKIFNEQRNNVKRAIVFLENWKPGHYFEIDGKAIVNWCKGDYVLWSSEVPHAASNIGIEPRYTLQITGVDNA